MPKLRNRRGLSAWTRLVGTQRRATRMLGHRDDNREALLDCIEEGSVLCTDGLATYQGVARDAEATVQVVVPRL